jgi:hypothetical protein
LSPDSVIAFADFGPSADTLAHGIGQFLEEYTMQARRSLTFLAAILITLAQALILAVDTSASAQAAATSSATAVQAASAPSAV